MQNGEIREFRFVTPCGPVTCALRSSNQRPSFEGIETPDDGHVLAADLFGGFQSAP